MQLSKEALEVLLNLTVGKGKYELREIGDKKRLTLFKGSNLEKEIVYEVQDEIVCAEYEGDKIFYNAVKSGAVKENVLRKIQEAKYYHSQFRDMKELIEQCINAKENRIDGISEGDLCYSLYAIPYKPYAEYQVRDADTEIVVRLPYDTKKMNEAEIVIGDNKQIIDWDNLDSLYDALFIEVAHMFDSSKFTIDNAEKEVDIILKDLKWFAENWESEMNTLINSTLAMALRYTECIRKDGNMVVTCLGSDWYEWYLEEDYLVEIPNLMEYIELKANLELTEAQCKDLIENAQWDITVEECKAKAKENWSKHYKEIEAVVNIVKRMLNN